MKPFSYIYQGQSHNAFTDHYLADGFKSYRIIMGDRSCVIIPSEIPGEMGQTVWQQDIQTGDGTEDQGLIQALGEGLYHAVA